MFWVLYFLISFCFALCLHMDRFYVAMYRVTRMDGIHVYTPSCQSGDDTYIANVVYHELLDDFRIFPRPQHSAMSVDKHEPGVEIHTLGVAAHIQGVGTEPNGNEEM
uniref:Secreted protein n=1 Tax=Globodera rostochiensis TaxID=31243 RepID=A0A914HKE1_GLORO